ncbi:unnamed protein product [Mucor hiemalis]
MSSSSDARKRRQEITSGRSTVQAPKRSKRQTLPPIQEGTPAQAAAAEAERITGTAAKPEVTVATLADPESGPSDESNSTSSADSDSGYHAQSDSSFHAESDGSSSTITSSSTATSSSAITDSERSPTPPGPVVPAITEANIVHGPVKTAAIKGTLKQYVLQHSRNREPQPYPIAHIELEIPHNKNDHRGLLHNEVWRVSPTFDRLAVSSFGRFLIDKFFLRLQDQFSRRRRHQPDIRFVMNEEERRVHNFPEVTQNLYHVEADEQVLLAFGRGQPSPESRYIIHLDGDFWNHSLDNLIWATHAEFYAHHPFNERIMFSRVASMNFDPRLPWQSNIHKPCI